MTVKQRQSPAAAPPDNSVAREVRRVYRLVLDTLTLSDAHRRELYGKRGLTDETIDALEFRTVDRSVNKVEKALREEFSTDDLIAAGVLELRAVAGGPDAKAARLSHVFTGDGILIPYFDDTGECITFRRHKYGLGKLRTLDGSGDEDTEAMRRAGRNAVDFYLPRLDVQGDDTLYIAESEFKAAANCQLGFWTVGLPGVSSFAGKHFERFVEWLTDYDVQETVIVFDTEDKATPGLPGHKSDVLRRYNTQAYAMRMAIQLERAGFPSKIATLPLDWDPERRKVDIDGALALGKTSQDFAEIYEDALSAEEYLRRGPEVTAEARRVLAAKLTELLMQDYSVTLPDDDADVPGGLVHHGVTVFKDGATKPVDTRITDAPLWISGTARTENGQQQFIEVSYTHRDNGRVRLLNSMERREDVLKNTELVKAAARGMPVNSTAAPKIVTYVAATEATVGRYLPTQLLVEKNGWVDSATGGFVLGESHFCASEDPSRQRVKLWVRGDGERIFADALRGHGDLEAWRAMAQDLRDASPIARIAISAAFAAPLIHLLGARNFVLHLYGPSGGAKTAVTKFATSAFGDPTRMKNTFHTTINAIERTAQLFSDMPLWIDELQLKANPEHQKTLTYLVASGQGKMRMNRDGGLRETVRFRNVALSTGEQPLVTDTDKGGEDARVLQIYGCPLEEDELGRAAHECAKKNYGHAGPLFLERLVGTESHELDARYQELFHAISSAFPGVHGSKIAARSVLALADILTRQWVLGDTTDVERLEIEAVELDHDLFAERTETLTPGQKAMEVTREWLATNPDHVEVDEKHNELRTPIYARVLADGRVYLADSLWKQWMRETNLEPSRALEDWTKEGWIEVTNERRGAGVIVRKAASRRIRGGQCRVVIVKAGHIDIDTAYRAPESDG